MEDLDKTLDIMERDKCTAMLAENSVRLKKNNIKFTTTQQKHSQAHLDAQYASYEKLIRTLIRQLINIEKKIRLKYLVPLESSRAKKLMASWNTEIEDALEFFKRKFRDVHKQRGSVEEFDNNIAQTLREAKILVDTEVTKLKDTLEREIGVSDKIQPSELSNIYGVDESVLIDLQVIDSLQEMHLLFKKLEDAGCDGEVFISLNETIKMYAKDVKKVEGTVWSGRSADQRKEIKMRVAKMNLNLKEIILSLYALIQQALLGGEKRNGDVISKIRNNLEKSLSLGQNLKPCWINLNLFGAF